MNEWENNLSDKNDLIQAHASSYPDVERRTYFSFVECVRNVYGCVRQACV